jgi:hypothetical protein
VAGYNSNPIDKTAPNETDTDDEIITTNSKELLRYVAAHKNLVFEFID